MAVSFYLKKIDLKILNSHHSSIIFEATGYHFKEISIVINLSFKIIFRTKRLLIEILGPDIELCVEIINNETSRNIIGNDGYQLIIVF